MRDSIQGKKLNGTLDYLNVVGSEGFSLKQLHPGNFRQNFTNVTYLENMFKYRAIKRVLEVAEDFNEEISEGAQFQDAWNSLANDFISATNAQCYYFIIKNFILKVNEVKDPKIHNVLTSLVVLFALSNFFDDNWGDIIDNENFRDIKKQVKKCLNTLRPNLVGLDDSFDYPDKALRSTIGRYDGNVYEALFEAAKNSSLNQIEPFDGYKEFLQPHLDLELLKRGNKPIQSLGKF